MKTIITLLFGTVGGALAFHANLPIPWLMGSLLIMVACKRLSYVQQPSKTFSSWVRIFFGFSLGSALSNSFASLEPFVIVTVMVSVVFVCLVTILGYFYFRKLESFTALDSFMSSLPGGMTFLVSLTDKLGDRFPKIALIHSVRMVSLLMFFTVFAFFIDSEAESESQLIAHAFSFQYDPNLIRVFLLAVLSGLLSKVSKIAGGDIIIPMLAAAVFYKIGVVTVPMPEIVITFSMVTFGCVIGCKIVDSISIDFRSNVIASLFFTAAILSAATVASVGLGVTFEKHYFLFLLALAPCSIPEICAIALTLGFDVGFVALIHTLRYLFIMLVGAVGCHVLSAKEQENGKTKVVN